VLNTFDSQWVSTPKTNPNDTAEPASHTKKAEFCFDSATGFLLRRRLLRNDATTAAGVAEDGADLLTVFGRNPDSSDISGNLISEKSYGGDVASLLTGSLCGLDLSSSTPRYDVRHTYQYGARATSQYFSSGAAMSFKTLDRTIDLSGAVSSERDTAGVTTSYTPDPADPLRIETVSSDGTAAINYTYANASASGSSFTPAQITVTQDDVTSRVQYDSFGRLWREFRTMPGVGEVTRETLYDSANRKLSQSMWDASSYANKTSYNYDFLGRLVSIDPPDHQTVNTAYVGDSLRTSTSTVVKTTDAAPSQTPTTTTERLDRFGRIWYVKEPDTFDANNATIPGTVTAYGYGVTGALARVCMGASLSTGALSTASCGQQRNFTYDNRGFLTSETHPENGTISYTYDALGHALTKRLATAGTIFDLNYTYDDAERLTLVESRNPYYPTTFRASKVFTFAPDNAGSNLKRGKLETAVRHNYHPAAGDIQVTETYTYGDAAGHLTARTTEVRNMSSQSPLNQSIYQSQSYSTLGMPSSITYPYCLTVQCGVANSGAVAMARTNGLLTAVFAPGLWNYATNLGYHPNGMISTVPHSNGVTDTQVNDPNGIPRPQSISFGQFGSCVAPVVTAPLDSVTIASGDQKIWYVNASGSGALTYQWYKDYVAVAGATTQGFTTGSLTSSHDYYVRVTNSCGTVQSNTATVSIAVPPSITGQPQSSTLSSPGSVHLTVAATGTPSPAYQWYQGASGGGSLISGATQSSYDTPTLNTTTQFWVRVSNVGGAVNSATATITVNPSLSAPTSLLATMQTTTSVQITWSTTQGAQHYEIWRRENAGALHKVGENTVNGYTDNTAAANTAYVYQVCASPSAGAACTSGYSNQDLATTVAFSDIVSDPRIRVSVLTELLTAVNAIRAASPGSAGVPVTWTGILQGSPAPPPPAVNGIAYGEHVLALRREMETARQNLLGVPPQSYVDPVLPGSPQVAIKAIHITELRSRAQ
jgi:YD repeat-containing protein